MNEHEKNWIARAQTHDLMMGPFPIRSVYLLLHLQIHNIAGSMKLSSSFWSDEENEHDLKLNVCFAEK